MNNVLLSALLITLCVSCKHRHDHGHNHEHQHDSANEHMHRHDFEDLVKRFESPERDEYQKPDLVLAELGDVSGQKIMEIGAGTGYFSFKLHATGAHVIAADVDERFQAYIENKKDSLNISDGLELRLVPFDNPLLEDNEVDRVLIANTYHHIENRSEYFKQVASGLKREGELIVIDFFKIKTPVGPPLRMRLSEKEVIDELTLAGFKSFAVNDSILPYQYIIRAKM